ncbi:hypothetical protein WA026_006579 [Henosepilachna vigintioctopunctata]|uniref:Uncharacterized protein n=1 Tax=Henosepilachna vigintioctopunctata TaxID=420089 RepID=A0AAW1UEP7_9CUCU
MNDRTGKGTLSSARTRKLIIPEEISPSRFFSFEISLSVSFCRLIIVDFNLKMLKNLQLGRTFSFNGEMDKKRYMSFPNFPGLTKQLINILRSEDNGDLIIGRYIPLTVGKLFSNLEILPKLSEDSCSVSNQVSGL